MTEGDSTRQTILVLDPSATDAQVADATQRMEALGWTVEASRGSEQLVLALSGGGSEEAVRRDLAGHEEIDVLPVGSGMPYRQVHARQRFLSGLVTGLVLLVAVGATLPVVRFLIPPVQAQFGADRIRAASVAQLPENSARLIRFGGEQILLIQPTTGRYFALGSTCTYMAACRLEWSAERRQLLCPCHGCVYDVRGNIVEGPPSLPLTRFAVERLDDQIYISRER